MDAYEAVVAVLVVGMVVGLPMMALSVRFALKPALDAWLEARRALEKQRTPAADVEAMKLRIAALEAVWEHRLGAGALEPVTRSREILG